MLTTILQRYDLGRRRLAIFVMTVSILAIIGWIFNISFFKSVAANLPTMNPLTAILLFLFGLTTLFAEKIKKRVRITIFVVLLAVSLARLLNFLWPHFRLDEMTVAWFGFPPASSQMAIATALSFCGLATAALLRDFRPQRIWLRQYVLLGVFTIAVVSTAGHLFGAGYVETLGFFSKMAIHTGILFICLSTAMIFSESKAGLMEIFASQSESGILVRQIMPWVLGLPFLIFWLGQRIWLIGWMGVETAAALSISVTVAVLLVLVWRIAQTIDIIDNQRNTMSAQLQSHERDLEKFKQASDAATDGVLITDAEANIVYVNQAWEKLTGYHFKEVRGKNPRLLKSEKIPPNLYRRMWESLAAGQPFRTEEGINRRKDGTEYSFESHVFPVQAKGKNVFFVELQQDITERKTIDRAKTEFVSLAAHQLTTPLSAISWFAELLDDGAAGKLNEQQQHLLSRITQSNRHMISLVNSLLNSSRIDIGTFAIVPQPSDLSQLVQQEVEESQAGFPDGPRASMSLPEKMPLVNVDPNLFTMIVQNLVTNALRYTPTTGQVAVDLRYDDHDAILTVTDNGIGIPEADQQKIFTKLFRSAVARQKEPNGNGLGLYIVKATIDQGGGAINFISTPGQGTTFTVRIPMSGMKERSGIRQLSRDL